jgi:hypothetical protein
MGQSIRGVIFFGFVAIAVGCAHAATSDPTTGTAPQASTFCGDYCTRLNACDNTKDEKTCSNACTNGNAATLPKLRSDIVQLISTCLQGKDCKTVLGGTVLGTCSDEAAASVAPSSMATNFCDAKANFAKKCNGKSDTAACLTMAKLYNDAALQDATDCTSKGCLDVQACIDAALGSIETGGGPAPSTTPDAATDPPATCTAADDLVPSAPAACSTCMATNCCPDATTCDKNAQCSGLFSCLGACTSGDATCQSTCHNQYPSGLTTYNKFASCVNSKCSTQCQ